MTEETQVAPSEATEEAVVSSEATENTTGQVEDQPAEDAEGKPEESKEEKSESAKRRERRKAELDRLRREADEAREAARKVEERLRSVRERAEKSNTPPKESDFQDYNEYILALGAFQAAKQFDSRSIQEVEQEAEQQKARIQQIQQMAQQEAAQNWAAQREDAKTRYADFDAVVTAPDLPINQHMANLIASSDLGADVAYYLGTNKDMARAIARLSPIEQAVEFGRIEARLSLPKPNRQTNAPDPVNPVRPKPSGMKDPAKMSFEEYREARKSGKIR